MSPLQTGKNKIKQICDILKNEALMPAKEEAQKIIEDAKIKAKEIVLQAENEAESIIKIARDKMRQEKSVFNSSLVQASRQSLQALKEDIENKLFDKELENIISKSSADEHLISKLILAIVESIKEEGVDVDLSVLVPKTVSQEKVNMLILDQIGKLLKEKSVIVGGFAGGAQVRLHDKRITIDISDEALKELLGNYVRKDFRKILFNS